MNDFRGRSRETRIRIPHIVSSTTCDSLGRTNAGTFSEAWVAATVSYKASGTDLQRSGMEDVMVHQVIIAHDIGPYITGYSRLLG